MTTRDPITEPWSEKAPISVERHEEQWNVRTIRANPKHRMRVFGTEYVDTISVTLEIPKDSLEAAVERDEVTALRIDFANDAVQMLMEISDAKSNRRFERNAHRRARYRERARIAQDER